MQGRIRGIGQLVSAHDRGVVRRGLTRERHDGDVLQPVREPTAYYTNDSFPAPGPLNNYSRSSSIPPVPRSRSTPKVKKGKTKATITFTGTDNSTGGLSFMCSLDANAAHQCTSPTTHKHLKPGAHSFFVVAQDPTGNLSAPATTSFKVKPR